MPASHSKHVPLLNDVGSDSDGETLIMNGCPGEEAKPELPELPSDDEEEDQGSQGAQLKRKLEPAFNNVTKQRQKSQPKGRAQASTEHVGRSFVDIFQNIIANITAKQPLVSEVFSIPRLVAMANKMGQPGGISLDIKNGWNALDQSHQDQAIESLLYLRPVVTMLSPPCTMFSALMRHWVT